MSGQNVFIAKYVFLFFFLFFKPDFDEVSKISRLCAFRSASFIKKTRSLQTGCNKCVKSGRPVILTTVFADCGRLAKCVFSHLKEFLLVHWNIGSDYVFFVFFPWTSVFVCCDRMGALSTLLFRSASVRFSHNRTTDISFSFLSLGRPTTLDSSFHIATPCIHSFMYRHLNRMGSFFLMYTVYKCTMSIFLWCPTTICIRNGQ